MRYFINWKNDAIIETEDEADANELLLKGFSEINAKVYELEYERIYWNAVNR